MTRPDDEHPDRNPRHGGRFEALLADSGIDPGRDAVLLSALADLEALGAGEPPTPSPALRDLLEASDAHRRAPGPRPPRSRRMRVAITTITVAACLSGAGVAAAAAGNQGFRQSVGHSIATVVNAFTPKPPVVRSSQYPEPTLAPGVVPPPQVSATTAPLLTQDRVSPSATSARSIAAGQSVEAARSGVMEREGGRRSSTPRPSESSVPSVAVHSPRAASPTTGGGPMPEPGRGATPRDPHPTDTTRAPTGPRP